MQSDMGGICVQGTLTSIQSRFLGHSSSLVTALQISLPSFLHSEITHSVPGPDLTVGITQK